MAGNRGESGGVHSEMTWIAFLLVAGIVAWVIWYKARHIIVWAAFGIDWVQFKALDLLGFLSAPGRQLLDDMQGFIDGRYDPFDVTWSYLVSVEKVVGGTTKWFMVALILLFAGLCTFRMRGDGLRRTFSLSGRSEETVFRVCGIRVGNRLLQFVLRILLTVTLTKRFLLTERKEWVNKGVSFMQYQASHWKVALAGANFDPDRENPAEEPSKTPLEWMKLHAIRLTKREGFDDEAAERAFQLQLGPSWQGVAKAPLHVQALCVLSALNAMRDKRVNSLRDRLTEIYVLQGGKAEAVKAALAPFLANERIVRAIDTRGAKHAFQNTAAIGIYGWGGPMREWGGEAGVLATSMFRWLKKEDRTLWYALNNVGRRAFHIEGAGAVAHFFAERVIGTPLAEAHVTEAVEGLALYLEEQGIMDLEDFFRPTEKF